MSNNLIKLSIKEEDSGNRLDVILTKLIPESTRSGLKKIIELKKVKINNSIEKSPSKKLRTNDIIEIDLISTEEIKILPTNIKLNVVYEDKDVLIVNKPAGMVVHPGAGNYKNTLVNALIYKYANNLSDINGSTRPGIVHRIDKETSGLLVVAKNNKAHSNLGKQFSEHTIQRTYQALAWGILRPLNGRVETLIGRSRKNRQLMSVTEITGKKSITNYTTLKIFNIKDIPKISFLECKLETGRTHQIRVHLASKKLPIIGDRTYDPGKTIAKDSSSELINIIRSFPRTALHARLLSFRCNKSDEELSFEISMPSDMENLVADIHRYI